MACWIPIYKESYDDDHNESTFQSKTDHPPTNSKHRHALLLLHLGLDPMTLICDLDLVIPNMYLHIKTPMFQVEAFKITHTNTQGRINHSGAPYQRKAGALFSVRMGLIE